MAQAQSFTNITPIQSTSPQTFTNVTPIGDQPQGFLSTLWSDIKNIRPSAQNPYPGMGQEEKTAAATAEAQRDQSRQAAGYSAPYRFVAPVAESLGVNVPGMEESARQGDPGGVMGHAAALPITYAATRALGAGGEGVLENAKPAWRMVGKTASAVGDSLDPDVVGLVSPRAAHALRLSSKVGKVASKLGTEPAVFPGAPLPEAPTPKAAALGELPATGAAPASQTGEALGQIPAPWRMRTQFPGAPLPEAPPTEVLQAQPIAAGAQPTASSPAAALGKLPAPWRMKSQASALGEVPTPATQPAAQTGEALASVPIAPWRMKPQAAALGDSPQAKATISQQLDDTLRTAVGNTAVKPGVPMRYQFKTPAPAEGSVAAPNIPEGHTPVEGSSAVRSFKYDPDAQEMHIAPTKGYTYVYGDASPDQATAFQNAESKGIAWGEIRKSNPLVAKIHENGTRTAVTPTNTAPSEDLTRVLQKSVDATKWKMKGAQ